MHNVLGFYAWVVAVVFAITGLVWGFQWFASGLYAVAGGEKNLVYSEPLSDTTKISNDNIPAIDKVFAAMRKEYPQAKAIEVHIPDTKLGVVAANANPDEETYWKLDYRYYDQYTLKETSVDHIYGRFPDAKAADKLLRMNYDIHTGAILGLAGKFFAFFISLIIASLPVTGTYIWLGRRNKENKNKNKLTRKHSQPSNPNKTILPKAKIKMSQPEV